MTRPVRNATEMLAERLTAQLLAGTPARDPAGAFVLDGQACHPLLLHGGDRDPATRAVGVRSRPGRTWS